MTTVYREIVETQVFFSFRTTVLYTVGFTVGKIFTKVVGNKYFFLIYAKPVLLSLYRVKDGINYSLF